MCACMCVGHKNFIIIQYLHSILFLSRNIYRVCVYLSSKLFVKLFGIIQSLSVMMGTNVIIVFHSISFESSHKMSYFQCHFIHTIFLPDTEIPTFIVWTFFYFWFTFICHCFDQILCILRILVKRKKDNGNTVSFNADFFFTCKSPHWMKRVA